MSLLVALGLLLGQYDVTKKPWEPGSIYVSPQAAKELPRMELFFQPLREVPPYRLAGQAGYERSRFPLPLLLGDLLFHAPKLLGARSGTFGLSCNTCHPGGAANNGLFVEQASDRPGNVDLLSGYFYPAADDGVFAPRNIPSLRGLVATAPYRRDGEIATLAQMDAQVVGHEFQQRVPPEWMAALDAYVAQLELLPTPHVGPDGQLLATASQAARRGEALFDAPRPGLEGNSCGSCHLKAQGFTDRVQHPLRHGEGKGVLGRTTRFDTPALRNLGETAPYFFDGSARDLRAAVAQLDRRHALQLGPQGRADLEAYLEAVGAVEGQKLTWSPEERVRQALAWGRLLEREGDGVWALCLDTMRHQVRQAEKVSNGKAPHLSRLATALERLAREPPSPAARERLLALREQAP